MSMLTVQYRMHELIMDWSSKELYDSKVHTCKTNDSSRCICSTDSPRVRTEFAKKNPFLIFSL